VSPVQIREEISLLFAFAKKIEINPAAAKLLMEAVESQEVILRALGGVVGRAVGFD
jgi:hypothetical protein